MLLFMLALYSVKALPEAFKLKMTAAAPLTDPALLGAEVDPGKWSLQV